MTDTTADLPSWRLPNGGRVDIPSDGRSTFDPVAAMTWEEHQDWENAWWGPCVNTFGEEAKQLTYADRMGLVNQGRDGQWPVYDLGEKSIMDIGGGPTSILLKCVPPSDEGGPRQVFDPCMYPTWVEDRYKAAGIDAVFMKGEDLRRDVQTGSWDEVWIYNVLQHVEDPVAILRNAARIGKVVRLFEWIDTPPAPGHPNTITAEMVRAELGPGGTIEDFTGSTENGCSGLAIHGVFEQDHAMSSPDAMLDLGCAIEGLAARYGKEAVARAAHDFSMLP